MAILFLSNNNLTFLSHNHLVWIDWLGWCLYRYILSICYQWKYQANPDLSRCARETIASPMIHLSHCWTLFLRWKRAHDHFRVLKVFLQLLCASFLIQDRFPIHFRKSCNTVLLIQRSFQNLLILSIPPSVILHPFLMILLAKIQSHIETIWWNLWLFIQQNKKKIKIMIIWKENKKRRGMINICLKKNKNRSFFIFWRIFFSSI